MRRTILFLALLALAGAAQLSAHQLENTLSFLDLDRMADAVAVAECTQVAGFDDGEHFRILVPLRSIEGLELKAGQVVRTPPPVVFARDSSQYRLGVSLVFLKYADDAWYALRGPFLAKNTSLKEWNEKQELPFLNHYFSVVQLNDALLEHLHLVFSRPSTFADDATAERAKLLKSKLKRQLLGDERPALYLRWMDSSNTLLKLSALADAVQLAELFPLPPETAAFIPADYQSVRERVPCPPKVHGELEQLALTALNSGDEYLHSAGLALIERIGIPPGVVDTFLKVLGSDNELLIVRREVARYVGLCPDFTEEHLKLFLKHALDPLLSDQSTDYAFEGLLRLVETQPTYRSSLENLAEESLAGESEDDLVRGILLLSAAGSAKAYRELKQLLEKEDPVYHPQIQTAITRVERYSIAASLCLFMAQSSSNGEYKLTERRALALSSDEAASLIELIQNKDEGERRTFELQLARSTFDPDPTAALEFLTAMASTSLDGHSDEQLFMRIRQRRGLPFRLPQDLAARIPGLQLGLFGLTHQSNLSFTPDLSDTPLPDPDGAFRGSALELIALNAASGFQNAAWGKLLALLVKSREAAMTQLPPNPSPGDLRLTLSLALAGLELSWNQPDLFDWKPDTSQWSQVLRLLANAYASGRGHRLYEPAPFDHILIDNWLHVQAQSGTLAIDRDFHLQDANAIDALFDEVQDGDSSIGVQIMGSLSLDRRCHHWFGATLDLDASGRAEVIQRMAAWREAAGTELRWDTTERRIVGATKKSTDD